jgi:hypothetical protein
MNFTSNNLSNQANLINLASDDLLGGYTYTSTAPMISSTPFKTNLDIPPLVNNLLKKFSILTYFIFLKKVRFCVFSMNYAAYGFSIDAVFQRDGNTMF